MTAPAPRPIRWYTAAVSVVAFGVLGFAAADLLGQLLFAVAARAGVARAWLGDPVGGLTLLSGLAMLGGFAVATLAIGRGVLGLGAAELRLRGCGPRAGGLGLGFAASALAVAVTMALGALLAGGGWVPDTGTLAGYAGRVAVMLVILAPAAAAEEVIFRGVPLVVLSRVWSPRPAALVLAALFALAHIRNPSISALSLANIGLAGVALAAAFFAPGGLWTAFGLHLGWNWAITALDAPVSGYAFGIPLIDYLPGRPAWLTGGEFGPEGGVVASLALAALAAGMVRWAARGVRGEVGLERGGGMEQGRGDTA